MDVTPSRPQRHLPLLAALALLFMGATLTAVTWRNLESQRELIDQHVLFAARTILRGVEANLARVVPLLARMAPDQAKSRLEDLLREITTSGAVAYLAVYDTEGNLLVSSAPPVEDGQERTEASLDPAALTELDLTGEWFGALPLGGNTLLAYVARVRPILAQFCPGPGKHRSGQPRPQPQDAYFLVGMSLDEHYAHYRSARRAALLQTGFVLAAAVLVWVPLAAYLRRREQTTRLARLEIFHSRLLDALPEGLVTIGADGVITAANPAAKAILGPDLAGRRFADLPVSRALDDCFASPPPAEGCGWRQAELHGRALEVLAVPLDDETLVLARDRTHLRSLERDLEESRQLAVIGGLAAGVAHEVRNPLSALRGFAQFFANKLRGKDPEETYARTMVQEADRLGRVVTDLLYLARPRPIEPRPVDLPALAGELANLLRFDFERRHAAWRADLAAPTVLADPDGLKQALINLILNALAALPEQGGTVTLASRAAPAAVSLAIVDNGRGMTGDERARALEAFFTTKKEGSGLGLAIVHKIVRDHKGALDIVSAPGQGTTVTLTFPEGSDSPQAPPAKVRGPGVASTSDEEVRNSPDTPEAS